MLACCCMNLSSRSFTHVRLSITCAALWCVFVFSHNFPSPRLFPNARYFLLTVVVVIKNSAPFHVYLHRLVVFQVARKNRWPVDWRCAVWKFIGKIIPILNLNLFDQTETKKNKKNNDFRFRCLCATEKNYLLKLCTHIKW